MRYQEKNSGFFKWAFIDANFKIRSSRNHSTFYSFGPKKFDRSFRCFNCLCCKTVRLWMCPYIWQEGVQVRTFRVNRINSYWGIGLNVGSVLNVWNEKSWFRWNTLRSFLAGTRCPPAGTSRAQGILSLATDSRLCFFPNWYFPIGNKGYPQWPSGDSWWNKKMIYDESRWLSCPGIIWRIEKITQLLIRDNGNIRSSLRFFPTINKSAASGDMIRK